MFFALLLLGISSCTKDDPIPEENQEEYDATQIRFINQSDPDEEILVGFDKTGHPDPHHIHLQAGAVYDMEITLFYHGESINPEVLDAADEHQFFFLNAPAGVLDYSYGPERVGLKGTLKVLKESEAFEWNLILRHGLDKSHQAAQQWDNPEYARAGGSDDLNIQFQVHPASGDDAHH